MTVPERAIEPSGFALIAFYTALVFAIGGAAAAPAHALLGGLGVAMSPVHEWTADFLKLLALLGIWPLLKWSGRGWREGLGMDLRGQWHHGAYAALVGLLSLALLVGLLLWLDVRVMRPELDPAVLARAALKALITALLVATIEELWFRGALHGVMQRAGATAAIVTVAVVYAALHFLRPDVATLPPNTWLDGYAAISGMFARFHDAGYWDSALALLTAGLLFGWLRQRTGHIAAAWGLHAGWVFVIQFSRRVTEARPDSDYGFLVGKYDGTIGVAFLLCALLCFYALRPLVRHPTATQK